MLSRVKFTLIHLYSNVYIWSAQEGLLNSGSVFMPLPLGWFYFYIVWHFCFSSSKKNNMGPSIFVKCGTLVFHGGYLFYRLVFFCLDPWDITASEMFNWNCTSLYLACKNVNSAWFASMFLVQRPKLGNVIDLLPISTFLILPCGSSLTVLFPWTKNKLLEELSGLGGICGGKGLTVCQVAIQNRACPFFSLYTDNR